MGPKFSPPIVTEDDILRGSKTIAVPTRKGSSETLTITALPWRVALAVAEMAAPGQAVAAIVSHCLPKEQATDAFLNTISPIGLTCISAVATALTMGIDGSKKNPPPTPTPIPPPSATTTPPNVS